MKAFDPALASPFRVDWLAPLDQVSQDDYTRAIAEKAEAILRGARFVMEQQEGTHTDIEIRVWVEAAIAPGCVSITWEPGVRAFGFHLLDDSLRDRLAAIVFRDLPCVDGVASDQQAEQILRAALAAIREAEEEPTIRIPVLEGPVDPGIDP